MMTAPTGRAAGPAAAWPSPGSTGTATITGRSLGISEAGISATTTAVSEAATHRQRERDRAVEGGIVNALSQWMSTECGIASAIPDFCAAYRRRPDVRH